jgi:hypothetical protein
VSLFPLLRRAGGTKVQLVYITRVDRVILSDEKLKINIECKAQKIIYIPKIATLVTTGI